MPQKHYGVKNLIRIANEYINPDTSTLDGIQKFLIGWFCFKFNTTENDDRLLNMTLEELMIRYQMHRIREEPGYLEEQTSESGDTFEDWLKEEMGADYVSEEDNVKQIEAHDKEYTAKIRAQFPDRIETDFSQFQKKE